MKRILLINSNLETTPYPVAPLGLSLVAASLKKQYSVKVLDFAFATIAELFKTITEFNPDYIGISIRNIDNVTMRKCKWYLQEIKEKIIEPIKTFGKTIIIGGSGFNIAPEAVFNYLNVDYGIYGEGEELMIKLLNKLDRKLSINELSGVISKNTNNINLKITLNNDLNIPNANIDRVLNFEPYRLKGNYPIQTKRGCTHKCIYCSYPNIEGKSYRLRQVNDIVNEMEEIHKRMPEITFEFVDSVFNSPLEHAIDICKEIITRKLNLKLRTMGVNPGDVTEELICLMKEAGFSQIDCTPDSASDKMIKVYKKNFSKRKLIECSQIIRKYNIPTMWFFMMGAPGETKNTILETFEFIDRYIFKEDMVHITEGIRILPDTELYEIAVKQNIIQETDNVLEPMFYVDPDLGKQRLTEILNCEIKKRNNVLNSIDTKPTEDLIQETLKYRSENNINEPMFRSLLRVENTRNNNKKE